MYNSFKEAGQELGVCLLLLLFSLAAKKNSSRNQELRENENKNLWVTVRRGCRRMRGGGEREIKHKQANETCSPLEKKNVAHRQYSIFFFMRLFYGKVLLFNHRKTQGKFQEPEKPQLHYLGGGGDWKDGAFRRQEFTRPQRQRTCCRRRCCA